MNIPTPAERLEIYEKMLPYFEGEERLIDRFRRPVRGFCESIYDVSGDYIVSFPEILKHDPHTVLNYWFPCVESGPDRTRTAILHQAISEVKQLINEHAILP